VTSAILPFIDGSLIPFSTKNKPEAVQTRAHPGN
jgi:hypothetical protein